MKERPARHAIAFLSLFDHQEVWLRKLAYALKVPREVALLRAFKAYVVLWQSGKLPPELTPEAMGPNPAGVPVMDSNEAAAWLADGYPKSRENRKINFGETP
jgi:hypothetical protein